jgi:hypothetical protein
MLFDWWDDIPNTLYVEEPRGRNSIPLGAFLFGKEPEECIGICQLGSIIIFSPAGAVHYTCDRDQEYSKSSFRSKWKGLGAIKCH